ncbi:galactose-3-O-sulfotransferase 2 [Tachysurus fulvidraco]|uniref:galactose-3-O-sulfotransferase 2 n=1 Tax=Tachysurus fulvidraco TaxID=1234273 RepID=UPI001FEFF359|nr:galactose-3-O-sulfotransferase 2 [Tachysurus fulvidraco]
MLPRLKRALRHNNASYRGSIPPWSACVRAVFCSHLRLIWHVLMLLTILCVVLQLMSAVLQARNKKTKPSDHKVISPLQNEQQDAQFNMENFDANKAALRHFQFNGGKEEGLNQLTEPARSLATTSGKILNPKLVIKVGIEHDPKSDLEVEQEVQKQALLKKGFHEVPLSGQNHDAKQTSSILSSVQNAMCYPKNHVVFLKTHKTASSTILNILYRYGDTHNLTFALPVNMHSQLYYPHFFMSHFVEGIKSHRVTEFHIMCNHMRFRGPEVRKVMPLDTFYFSILRNPVSMMESLFTYYKSIPAFRKFKTLEDFLRDDGNSYSAATPSNHYARNILTFDFGFNNSAPQNEVELDQQATSMIASVESEFHLILISEYFDESMVLLRHALCWTLEDVTSFRLNSRSNISRKSLSAEMTEQVKKWSSLDWRLYQHFNASFWRRIDTLIGRDKLQEEVELLRARRAVLEQTCLLGGKAVDPAHVHDSSLKPFQYGIAVIQGYNLRPGLDNNTHQLCQRLITPELQYTMALYKKQFPDLAAKMANKKAISTEARNTHPEARNANVHELPKGSRDVKGEANLTKAKQKSLKTNKPQPTSKQ